MSFVDDVDLVATGDSEKIDVLAQVTDIVYSGIRGGIDLDDVWRAAPGDLTTGETCIARLTIFWMSTVHRLGEQPGGASLPGAAGPTEEVGMRQAVIPHRISQRTCHRFLTYEVGKGLGSPFAIERL